MIRNSRGDRTAPARRSSLGLFAVFREKGSSGMAASKAAVLDGTPPTPRDLTDLLLSNPFFASFDPEIVEVLAPHCSIEGFPRRRHDHAQGRCLW